MGELDRVKAGMIARAAGALQAIGDDLAGESAREAPVEEGTLRGAATVEVEVTAQGVEVVVAFPLVYAARQHEETSWRHPIGGKAKFLEDPLKARIPRYERALAAAVGKGI